MDTWERLALEDTRADGGNAQILVVDTRFTAKEMLDGNGICLDLQQT